MIYRMTERHKYLFYFILVGKNEKKKLIHRNTMLFLIFNCQKSNEALHYEVLD